jgi:hypothetical protein
VGRRNIHVRSHERRRGRARRLVALYPDSYATLRDRLDDLHSSAQEPEAEVIDLPAKVGRPQRGRKTQ